MKGVGGTWCKVGPMERNRYTEAMNCERNDGRGLMRYFSSYSGDNLRLFPLELCFDYPLKSWHSIAWLSKSRLMNMSVITYGKL